MSKHVSEIRARRPLGRFWRHVRGAAAIEFAFVLPLLVGFTVAALEFGLILFDYQRAGEATRRGVRDLVINPPLATLDVLKTDGTVVCVGGGAGVTCTGGNIDASASDTFAVLYEKMRVVFSDIEPQNVSITYSASGIDVNPGVVTPVVTLNLTGMRHEFFILQIIPGVSGGFDFPPFAASRVTSTQAL